MVAAVLPVLSLESSASTVTLDSPFGSEEEHSNKEIAMDKTQDLSLLFRFKRHHQLNHQISILLQTNRLRRPPPRWFNSQWWVNQWWVSRCRVSRCRVSQWWCSSPSWSHQCRCNQACNSQVWCQCNQAWCQCSRCNQCNNSNNHLYHHPSLTLKNESIKSWFNSYKYKILLNV